MRKIKIGRSQSNDVVISNPVVSGEHAVLFVMDDGSIMIKDLSSTNGTYVNSNRINDMVLLKPGDVVKLGDSVFDWQGSLKSGNKTIVNPKPKIVIPSNAKEYRTIGRNPDSQIQFAYNDVSGSHAILCKMMNDDVMIFDNSSTNGTFVNGERVTSRVLRSGDVVMIANKYQLNWNNYFQLDSARPVVPQRERSMRWGVFGGIAAAVAVILVACYFLFFGKWTADKIYSHYKDSIVFVYRQVEYKVKFSGLDLQYAMQSLGIEGDYPNSGFFGGSGSGSFISRDGKVLTNRHVVSVDEASIKDELIDEILDVLARNGYIQSEADAIELFNIMDEKITIDFDIQMYIGRNDTHISTLADLFPCQIIRVSDNENIDAAIIQLNTKKTPDDVKNIVDLEKYAKDIKPGSELFTIGFPKGFELGTTAVGMEANVQSGSVTQEKGDFHYGHNLKTISGASGSPIFDNRGRFAGLHFSGMYQDGTPLGYSFAVKPEMVCDFFKKPY